MLQSLINTLGRSRFLLAIGFFSLLLVFGSFFLQAQTPLQTRVVAQSLDTPWEIQIAPDSSIWVSERPGRITKIIAGASAAKLLLRLTDVYEQDGRETGLMGFCLHPEFPDVPHVFLSYNYLQSAPRILGKIVRYTYSLDTLINPEVILDNIPGANIHTGSRLAFGPDGKLYITTGDAANPQIAQNLQSIAGKILRINPDGSIPADNPFPGRAVWSFGHRNPQGLVWAANNLLYSSEHGAQTDDEVNVILKGRNYGWPNVEGYCDAPNERLFCQENDVVEPIKGYTPTIAVAGLGYYNHNAISEWKNSLLIASLNTRGMDLRQLQLSALGDSILSENIYFDQEWGRLRGICVSPWGSIFISTSNRDGRGAPTAGDDKIIEIFNPLVTGNHSLQARALQRQFVYPNPACSVRPPRLKRGQRFTIFQPDGKLIYQTASPTEILPLEVFSGKGVYFIHLEEGRVEKLIWLGKE